MGMRPEAVAEVPGRCDVPLVGGRSLESVTRTEGPRFADIVSVAGSSLGTANNLIVCAIVCRVLDQVYMLKMKDSMQSSLYIYIGIKLRDCMGWFT